MSRESQFSEVAPWPVPPGRTICAMPIPVPGCQLAPNGRPLDAWYCTLPTGHAGPCANPLLSHASQNDLSLHALKTS
jgi:hypothetical protein